MCSLEWTIWNSPTNQMVSSTPNILFILLFNLLQDGVSEWGFWYAKYVFLKWSSKSTEEVVVFYNHRGNNRYEIERIGYVFLGQKNRAIRDVYYERTGLAVRSSIIMLYITCGALWRLKTFTTNNRPTENVDNKWGGEEGWITVKNIIKSGLPLSRGKYSI